MVLVSIIFIILVLSVSLIIFYIKVKINNITDDKNIVLAVADEVNSFAAKGLTCGLVVGLYKEGKTHISHYGKLSLESTNPPDDNTIFQLASVTKLFTASVLQILCDAGELEMENTLDDLIGSTVELSPIVAKITLLQLVTHTSGLPGIPKPLFQKIIKLVGKKNILINPYSYLDSSEIFDYLRNPVGIRKPGSFKYSNYGMGLLGHIMEKVTKQSLECLIADKLTTLLEMKNTSIELNEKMRLQLAPGYTRKSETNPRWSFSALAGAGALQSSVSDMMKFIKANIENELAISQSLKKMQIRQAAGVCGIGWIQASFFDRFFGNSSIVWHSGMVGGYTSFIAIDPNNKSGVVLLSNKAVDITFLGKLVIRHTRTQSWAV